MAPPTPEQQAEQAAQETQFVRERRRQAWGWLGRWCGTLAIVGVILYVCISHGAFTGANLFGYGKADWVVGILVVIVTGWFIYRILNPNLMRLHYGHGTAAFGFVGALVLFIVLVSWLYFTQVLPRVLHELPTAVGSSKAKETGEAMTRIGEYLKAVALLAAGVFFVYKMYTGWLIINMSAGLSATRHVQSATDDLVIATLTLKKGSIDTLWLTQVAWRVRILNDAASGFINAGHQFADPGGGEVLDMPNRYAIKNGHLQSDPTNAQDWVAEEQKNLTLSPGEEYTFAKALRLPHDKVCQIEVVVLGSRPLWLTESRGQWRAVVVVPLLPFDTTRTKAVTVAEACALEIASRLAATDADTTGKQALTVDLEKATAVVAAIKKNLALKENEEA